MKAFSAVAVAVLMQSAAEPKPDPNGLECNVCKSAVKTAVDKGADECKAFCKKAGSLDGVCEQACTAVDTECNGQFDCATKICTAVHLCTNQTVAVPMKATSGAGSCTTPHADKTSCDADAACTWCSCAALPSACWLKTDAKKLPNAVYKCDGMISKQEPKPDPNGLECTVCKSAVKTAVDKGADECKALCKKAGSLDGVCEQACAAVDTECNGQFDCATKICTAVHLCANQTIVV